MPWLTENAVIICIYVLKSNLYEIVTAPAILAAPALLYNTNWIEVGFYI